MSEFVRESVAAYGASVRPMTVHEYYLAADSGIFDADEKLELIRGEVVQLSPQKSPHAWATTNLIEVLREVFAGATFRAHSPLRLDNFNEPEPDVLVAAGPISRYKERHPGAEDVLLLIEVADTSLRKDRTLKAALYAEFGISEFWILDLKSNRLEVYREPDKSDGTAKYRVMEVIARGGSIVPLAAEGAIEADDILPDLP